MAQAILFPRVMGGGGAVPAQQSQVFHVDCKARSYALCKDKLCSAQKYTGVVLSYVSDKTAKSKEASMYRGMTMASFHIIEE